MRHPAKKKNLTNKKSQRQLQKCVFFAMRKLDLDCVNDPKNAKEEKQLGVQSLGEITIIIISIAHRRRVFRDFQPNPLSRLQDYKKSWGP